MVQFITPQIEVLVAGVYRVRFSTGHFYIGSSLNLKNRFIQWQTRLRNGVRKNIDMLVAFEKSKTVEFDVIEIVDNVDNLLLREDFFIKLFIGIDKCLNKSTSAFKSENVVQSEHRLRSKMSQPVVKINPDGDIVERYGSILEAAKRNGTNPKSISFLFKRYGRKYKGFVYRKVGADGTIITPPVIPRKSRPKGYKVSEKAKESMRLSVKKERIVGL